MKNFFKYLWILSALLAAFLFEKVQAANPEILVQVMTGKQDFRDASVADQQAIFNYFARATPNGKFMQSYYVDRDDPVIAFVNPDLRKRLYHFNDRGSEANCYWTTMFALSLLALPERFMDIPEYLNYTQTKFRLVDTVHEDLKAGDVMRLKRARGNMEIHSVLYLGNIPGSTMQLVLSKNGANDGPYLIMNMSDLQVRFYPSTYVAGTYRLLP